MKKFLILWLELALLVVCNGCALFATDDAPASGTVVYSNGELGDTEGFSMNSVHVATVAGVQDLGFTVIDDSKDPNHSQLIVRTSSDQKIKITLIQQSPRLTNIRIRVGAVGDEVLSRQILDKIKSHL